MCLIWSWRGNKRSQNYFRERECTHEREGLRELLKPNLTKKPTHRPLPFPTTSLATWGTDRTLRQIQSFLRHHHRRKMDRRLVSEAAILCGKATMIDSVFTRVRPSRHLGFVLYITLLNFRPSIITKTTDSANGSWSSHGCGSSIGHPVARRHHH